MSKKNKPSQKNRQNVRQTKKAVVMGTEKKSRLALILMACAVLIVGAGVFVVLNQGGGNAVTAQTSAVASANVEQVSFPVALFGDGKARHFEHAIGNQTIRFFVLKSSDGIIRAAFDACDVCWPAGKGYYQDGDVMVCRNCGRRFASVLVNEVKGGCNPAPLTRMVQDGNVIIKVKDIAEGKQFFNFT
jgi:uncharacterized membrane protein